MSTLPMISRRCSVWTTRATVAVLSGCTVDELPVLVSRESVDVDDLRRRRLHWVQLFGRWCIKVWWETNQITFVNSTMPKSFSLVVSAPTMAMAVSEVGFGMVMFLKDVFWYLLSLYTSALLGLLC